MLIDYISIGSIGFAQLGDVDYLNKAEAEKIVLMNFFKKHHPIPLEFSSMCIYSWMSFPHDFGNYFELVIKYDQIALEDSDNPFFQDNFWDFVNRVLDVYLETESFEKKAMKEYKRMIDCKQINPSALSSVA